VVIALAERSRQTKKQLSPVVDVEIFSMNSVMGVSGRKALC